MKKYFLGAVLLGVLVVVFILWRILIPSPKLSDVILFYGKECPHCQELEKFIEDNGIKEKLSFDYLEIWHNRKNAKIIEQKADECGFTPKEKENLGVPFLFAKGKCLIGTDDIEAYFKQETGSGS